MDIFYSSDRKFNRSYGAFTYFISTTKTPPPNIFIKKIAFFADSNPAEPYMRYFPYVATLTFTKTNIT